MQNHVIARGIKAVLAQNATAQGIVEVSAADAPNLWPGAICNMGADAVADIEVLILEDLGSNKFKVRLTDPTIQGGGPAKVPAGGSDLSAYTTAKGAFILQQSGQTIFQYPHEGVVPRTPSALK